MEIHPCNDLHGGIQVRWEYEIMQVVIPQNSKSRYNGNHMMVLHTCKVVQKGDSKSKITYIIHKLVNCTNSLPRLILKSVRVRVHLAYHTEVLGGFFKLNIHRHTF